MLIYFVVAVFVLFLFLFFFFLLFTVCQAGYRLGSDGKTCEGTTSFN